MEKCKNIEYIFNCGNDNIISCRGVHKVTTDDVLNCIFGRLIHLKEIKEEELTNEIIEDYYLRVKEYIDSLTNEMFSHWNSIQIELEIAIGFMPTKYEK